MTREVYTYIILNCRIDKQLIIYYNVLISEN